MRRRTLIAALATIPLAGTACTSVPVSTMWKLARLDETALVAIDPADLRAAVLIDARATMRQVTMAVTLTPKGGKEATFEIPIAEPSARNAGLPPAPAGRRWEAFALGSAGQREFARMRSAALALPRGSELALRIVPREGDVPPALMSRFPLRIELMLDPKEGWFTLMRDTTLDLEAMARKT